MEKIKIVHISDLHISEHLTRGADAHFNIPHRYGHNVQAFLALDGFLKKENWDLLVITGDISRIGNSESFEYVRNWLENEISIGAHSVGLNLSKDKEREYIIIPGNHDRFNGSMVQGSLEKYNHEFPVVRSGTTDSIFISGVRVNMHLYDSTQDNQSFAYGFIDQKNLTPKNCSSEDLDIALLHHHFLQPPEHERCATTELTNSAEVAAYFLNSGFDGVFFGHTHQGYIGTPSIESLSRILKDKRTVGRFWRRLLPKYILRKLEGECLVSYKRVSAKNGQFPTLDSYFDYLYMLKNGEQVSGPENFDKIKEFYHHLDQQINDNTMKNEIEEMKSKKVLISLAPSACQEEAKTKGFHVVTFTRNNTDETFSSNWRKYQFDGTRFVSEH